MSDTPRDEDDVKAPGATAATTTSVDGGSEVEAEHPEASELKEAAGDRQPPQSQGIVEYARAWWQRVRAGDLGNLPIILGLLIITVVFTTLNERFLSSINFVNLIVQASPYAVIAVGVVFVLVIAEVDLSVGYLSGMASVVLARLLGEEGWPVVLAILAVLAVGLLAGFAQGYLVAKVGLPSLIVTLGGLVGFNGLVLILIGGRGTIVIQDPVIIDIANLFLPSLLSYVLVLAGVGALAAMEVGRFRRRRAADLPTTPVMVLSLKYGAMLVGGLLAVYFASRSRGVPFVALLLAVLLGLFSVLLNRSPFGRHVYSIGGNPEAARRAGVSVDRLRIACFMISGLMAASGGIVFASRLRSVDTGAGGGQIELNVIAAVVIGGVSLFGGRGKVSAALFGTLVIIGVDNGMGLLGLSSGAKFVVTAAVLLLAVLVDSIARRGRAKSGVA